MLDKTPKGDELDDIVDDILEKMPDPFRLHEMMAKCEDKTPYIVVCFQVTFV